MTDDDWTRAALSDDALVVELLLRLNRSSWVSLPAAGKRQPPPQSQRQYQSLLPLPLGWGHRQPRSKPATTTTTTATTTTTCSKKERETTRCSPTTPLSWSGASTSDGSDESSRPSDRSSGGRSKAVFPTECATATTNKKSRKRKTFAELKEEEGFLLKERTHLKKELASMQVTFKEQIARSANLKRLKHGLRLQSGNNMEERSDKPATTISYQCNQMEASSSFNQAHSVLLRHSMHNNQVSMESCKVQKDVKTQERGFVLPDLNVIPDLNMTPTEEESGSENLYAMN